MYPPLSTERLSPPLCLINMISILCADCSREAISSSSCMRRALVRTGTLRRFPVIGSTSCSSSVKALKAHLLTMCVCRTPCSHAHQLALPVQCCNVSRDTKFAETHRRAPVCLGHLWCHVAWPAVCGLRGGTSMPLRARTTLSWQHWPLRACCRAGCVHSRAAAPIPGRPRALCCQGGARATALTPCQGGARAVVLRLPF